MIKSTVCYLIRDDKWLMMLRNKKQEIYVYQTNDYIGTLQECDEGTLAYIPKDEILNLELWEGDRIFLEKMFRNEIPFSISLYYDENEVLINTEVKEANSNE